MFNFYLSGGFMSLSTSALMDKKLEFLVSETPFNPSDVTKDIGFLINNRIALQQEYDNLKQVYDSNDLSPKMADWFVHVCAMQEALHYKHTSEARKYKKQALVIHKKELEKEYQRYQLRPISQNSVQFEDSTESFEFAIRQLEEEITALDLQEKQPREKISLEHARKQLSTANMLRLETRFAMITAGITATILLQYNRFVSWIQMLSQQPMDVSILEWPVSTYNVLSVGIFGLRTIANVTDIVQTALNANEEEQKLFSFWERLAIAADKHEGNLWNDSVWIVINFFTNFPQFLRQLAPFANQIVAAFLIFDVLVLLRMYYKENKRVLEHQKSNRELLTDLNKQLEELETCKKNENNPLKIQELSIKIETIKSSIVDIENQNKKSNYKLEKTQWMYACYFAAGLFLLAGFSAAIILSPPMFMPLCFFACNIGIALYMSGEIAGEVMEKRMINRLESQLTSEKNTKKEADDALKSFGISMLEHTFVPLAIMTVFTMSWPLAIVLTAVYIAAKTGLLTEAKTKIGNELSKIPVPGFFLRTNGYGKLGDRDDELESRDDDEDKIVFNPLHFNHQKTK